MTGNEKAGALSRKVIASELIGLEQLFDNCNNDTKIIYSNCSEREGGGERDKEKKIKRNGIHCPCDRILLYP